MNRLTPAAVILALLAAAPLAAEAQDEWLNVDMVVLSSKEVDTLYVTLGWTAPAAWDNWDLIYVPVTYYDLRMSTSGPVTEYTWANALRIEGEPTPAPAGTPESMRVTDLAQGKTYWFAMRAYADSSWGTTSWGALPNPCHSATTLVDTTPPAPVTILGAYGETESQIRMTWVAPGDDGSSGRAAQYDIRYSTLGPITTMEQFEAATPIDTSIAPIEANAEQSHGVWPLVPDTTYWFSIRAGDEVNNWSQISGNSIAGTTLPEHQPGHGGPCGGSVSGRLVGSLTAALLLACQALACRRVA